MVYDHVPEILKKQYRSHILKDSLLLYQAGSFFNIYNEDAVTCVLEFGLNYAGDPSKEKAGIPVQSLDDFISKVMKTNKYSVAVIRQMENDKQKKRRLKLNPEGSPTIQRKLDRIYTPGTHSDGQNHSIFAVAQIDDQLSLTVYNHYSQQHFSKMCTISELTTFTLRYAPVEVLYMGSDEIYKQVFVRYVPQAIRRLGQHAPTPHIITPELEWVSQSILFHFFEQIKQPHLKHSEPTSTPRICFIDPKTRYNFQIPHLSQMFEPVTEYGERWIQSRLNEPYQREEEIEKILSLVEKLVTNPDYMCRLRQKLGNIPKGLYQQLHYLRNIPLEYHCTEKMLSMLQSCSDSFQKIIHEWDLDKWDYQFDIPSFSTCTPKTIQDSLNQYELSCQELFQHQGCKIKTFRGKGRIRYQLIIPLTHYKTLTNIPNQFSKSSVSKTEIRFISPELIAFSSQYADFQEQEQERITSLFHKSLQHFVSLPADEVLNHISSQDGLSSFAYLAWTQKWCKPTFSSSFHLKGFRMSPSHIPNHLHFNQGIVLTGANGSGKSTLMRAVALVSLLAHCGSYVPAEEATIPLLKHIFLRFGAKDNLFQGESSFEAEIKHMKYIMDHATPNSLILIDEFGSSTSAKEGSLIALKSYEWLQERFPFVIFATHYFEVAKSSQKPMKMTYPYTYEVSSGQVHSSHAYDILKRFGIVK